MNTFRYYDHPRNVIALLRAMHPNPDSVEATIRRGHVARQRRIPIDVPDAKYLRETLWETLRLTYRLTADKAASTGRTVPELLDEWQVEIEASIPPGHNKDEPPDRGLRAAPG